jgi:hypothetical protein
MTDVNSGGLKQMGASHEIPKCAQATAAIPLWATLALPTAISAQQQTGVHNYIFTELPPLCGPQIRANQTDGGAKADRRRRQLHRSSLLLH